MDISERINVKLTPEDIKEILMDSLKETKGIQVDHVIFNVGGYETEGDWRAELPLDYRLDAIHCSGIKI